LRAGVTEWKKGQRVASAGTAEKTARVPLAGERLGFERRRVISVEKRNPAC
jgi:hypothetical protein